MHSTHLAHLNSSIIYIQNIHKQKGHDFSSLLYWLHLTTASGKALPSHTLKCLWFNQVFVGGVWESLGDGGIVRLLHTHPTPSNTPVTGSLFGHAGQNFHNLLPVSPCAVITDEHTTQMYHYVQ